MLTQWLDSMSEAYDRYNQALSDHQKAVAQL
jgi:hypothetical protein